MGVCGLCVLVILPKMYIFPHFHKQKLAFIYGVRYIVSTQWHFANSIFFSFLFIAVAAFFMVLFSFLFSIDFCMLSCSYIVCTFRMLSWLLYIYWSEDEEKKHIVTSMGSNTRSSDDYIMCWWVLEEDWQKASTILYTKIHFKWNE